MRPAKPAFLRRGGLVERVGRPRGRVLALAVGHHARPGVVDVGRREAAGEGQAGDAAALQPRDLAVEAAGRLDQGAAAGQGDQEGKLAVGLVPRPPPRPGVHEPMQQPQGACAGLRHVDVRIGAIDHQAVGQLHHLRGDVGVQVQADDDRQVRAQAVAQAAQQLALAVLVRLADHRAVQVEVEAVEAAQGVEVGEDLADDPLVGVDRHLVGGASRPPRTAARPGGRGCGPPRSRRRPAG